MSESGGGIVLPGVEPGEHLPMFPLGTVLLTGGALPLRVFEPRYLAMMQQVLSTDGRFGVTLIERGSEVGGGDVRTDIGTLAVVVRAEGSPAGHLALLAVGTMRLRVRSWLTDDPYPAAVVDPFPYPDAETAGDLAPAVADLAGTLRMVLALAAELGERVPPATFELPGPAADQLDTLANLAPVGPLDRQRYLGTTTRAGQVEVLRELLADELLVLEARRAELE